MIIKPYTSGTMRTGWRGTVEQMYRDLIREQVGQRWKPQHVPPDYTRPRQEMDELVSAVQWLHPSPPPLASNGHGGPSFYVPRNLRLIHDCDLVLSCIYPGYTSVDSAHEIGVAYAWGKPIITVDLTHGEGDYAAWRTMSMVVLDTLEDAAAFLLYQVQGTPELIQATESDKLPRQGDGMGYTEQDAMPRHGKDILKP